MANQIYNYLKKNIQSFTMKIKKILSLIKCLKPTKGDIIAKQACQIDALQMQCDLYKELSIEDKKQIEQLDWELNTSNIDDTDLIHILRILRSIINDSNIERDEIDSYFQRDLWDYINYEKCRNGDLQPNDVY